LSRRYIAFSQKLSLVGAHGPHQLFAKLKLPPYNLLVRRDRLRNGPKAFRSRKARTRYQLEAYRTLDGDYRRTLPHPRAAAFRLGNTLKERNPAAASFLQNIDMDAGELGLLTFKVVAEGGEMEDVVSAWIEENCEMVDGWLGLN